MKAEQQEILRCLEGAAAGLTKRMIGSRISRSREAVATRLRWLKLHGLVRIGGGSKGRTTRWVLTKDGLLAIRSKS